MSMRMQDAWGNPVAQLVPKDTVSVAGDTVLPGLLGGNVTTLQLQSASGAAPASLLDA